VVLYQVLFEVDNADGVLRPQMSAQVNFVRARVDNALVVPSAALAAAARARDASMTSPKKSGQSTGKVARSGIEPVAYAGGAGSSSSPADSIAQVQVLSADGEVELRNVRVGIRTRNAVQVLAGLAEGETVITGLAGDGAAKSKGGSKTTSLGKLF
jgi:membrane fusion protein, macrolide-specific efflux system